MGRELQIPGFSGEEEERNIRNEKEDDDLGFDTFKKPAEQGKTVEIPGVFGKDTLNEIEAEEEGLYFETPKAENSKEAKQKAQSETEITMKELLFSQQGEQVQTMYNPELSTNLNRKKELQKLIEDYENPPLSNLEKQKLTLMSKKFDKSRDSFYVEYGENDLANYASIANQNEMQFLIEHNPESAKILSASIAGEGIKAKKALEIISRMKTTENSKLSPEFKKDLIDIKLESNPELINALPEEMQVKKTTENPRLLPNLSRNAKKTILETTPQENLPEILQNLDKNNLDLLTEIENFENNPTMMKKLSELSIEGPDFFLNLPDDIQKKVLTSMKETSRNILLKTIDKYTSRSDVQMSSRFISKKLQKMIK